MRAGAHTLHPASCMQISQIMKKIHNLHISCDFIRKANKRHRVIKLKENLQLEESVRGERCGKRCEMSWRIRSWHTEIKLNETAQKENGIEKFGPDRNVNDYGGATAVRSAVWRRTSCIANVNGNKKKNGRERETTGSSAFESSNRSAVSSQATQCTKSFHTIPISHLKFISTLLWVCVCASSISTSWSVASLAAIPSTILCVDALAFRLSTSYNLCINIWNAWRRSAHTVHINCPTRCWQKCDGKHINKLFIHEPSLRRHESRAHKGHRRCSAKAMKTNLHLTEGEPLSEKKRNMSQTHLPMKPYTRPWFVSVQAACLSLRPN